jgi:hypothetical protein
MPEPSFHGATISSSVLLDRGQDPPIDLVPGSGRATALAADRTPA